MVSGENSQLERFKEATRELETAGGEAKFNEKLGKLVKQKLSDKKELDNG